MFSSHTSSTPSAAAHFTTTTAVAIKTPPPPPPLVTFPKRLTRYPSLSLSRLHASRNDVIVIKRVDRKTDPVVVDDVVAVTVTAANGDRRVILVDRVTKKAIVKLPVVRGGVRLMSACGTVWRGSEVVASFDLAVDGGPVFGTALCLALVGGTVLRVVKDVIGWFKMMME